MTEQISEGPHEVTLDFGRLQNASEGDPEFERELLGVFLSDCGRRVGALANAVQASDTEVLRREAHTIKGASSNIGALRLQQLAYEMEKLVLAEARGRAEQLSGEIADEFERVHACIDTYLAGQDAQE